MSPIKDFDFPILMYHAVLVAAEIPGDPQLSDPGARRYALEPAVFGSQMRSIANGGMSVPRSWTDLDGIPPPRPCWITFDDGHRSNHDVVLPILLKQGLSAMFFITTDWIGKIGFMNEEQIRALHREGMLLGTHGCSHRYLSDLEEPEVYRELKDSKEKLESVIGEKICAISLPGGRNHPSLRAMCDKLGYRHVFTSRIALAGPDADPLAWPRIPITNVMSDEFVSQLVGGDYREVRKMARAEKIKNAAKNLLGNVLYDKVRGMVLRGK